MQAQRLQDLYHRGCCGLHPAEITELFSCLPPDPHIDYEVSYATQCRLSLFFWLVSHQSLPAEELLWRGRTQLGGTQSASRRMNGAKHEPYPGAQPRLQSWGSSSLVYGITTLLQKKIRKVYPVWCSRLHNHTIHQKATRKRGGPDPQTPSGCAHGHTCLYCPAAEHQRPLAGDLCYSLLHLEVVSCKHCS